MKIGKRLGMGIFLLLMAKGSYAAICSQTNNTVGFVGLDNADGTVYVRTSNHDNQCGCNDFRFLAANTKTDMVLSLLLTARLADKKVRIDLNDANACNSAVRVYIQ